MKIMIVISYFYPKIGGAEKVALEYALGYKNNGHKVIVVTTNYKKTGYKREIVKGINVIRLPIMFTISNSPFNPFWFIQIKKIIKKERPDIIQAHTPVPGLADIAFAAKGKTKFIVRYNSGSMKKNKKITDLFIVAYEKIILKHILKNSDAVSTSYESFVRKEVGAGKKVDIITPGVDCNEFSPDYNKKKTSDIIFVGRIERSSSWKGIGTLLLAVREVVKFYPNISLKFVGNGDAVNDYKKQAVELGIENNVVFSGTLRGNKLVNTYRSSKMLVLPSESEAESFGIVLIEAMACGIPVIGSRIGGIPNVIQDSKNGILVSPKKPTELDMAIKKLMNDPNLVSRLGKNGREYVKNNFDVQATIIQYENLLKYVVSHRVVHVVPTYPPNIGGMEKVAQIIARTQKEHGVDVAVITSNQEIDNNYIDDKVQVTRLKCFNIMHTPVIPGLFFKLLKIQKDTVVHLHIAHAYTPEIVWIASKLKGFRYIAQVHLDVGPTGPAGFLLKIYKPFILKRVLNSASFVVVFNKDQKNNIHHQYGIRLTRIKIIPNGVENKFYSKKLRVIHKKPKLLFVGRLSVQKNIPQLLHALEGISDQFETQIVGNGELEQELKELAKKVKLQNMIFYGRKEGNDLLKLYNDSDIFVLPSEREGMPLVLLEAMAMGLPIVATNVTGNYDIVKDGQNGLLVPHNDADALRFAILKIKNSDNLYKKMSKISHKMAEQYSWDKIIKQFEILYGAIK